MGLSKPIEDDSPEDQEVPEHLIRNFRPPHLKFRIGNVVLTNKMTAGIIVGWNIDITVSLSLKYSKYYKLTCKIV